MSTPLKDLRVVEIAGLGPSPHACMLLSDLGADIVRIERPGDLDQEAFRHTLRGRTIVHADLKVPSDLQYVRSLISKADVLVEGFRPGVMERLGIGPQQASELNPRLIYARMTGWGQDGPMAERAGHDINYISLTGALHAIGDDKQPLPPLNLSGDYGGGSMMLLVGVLSALYEREHTGNGQVVDAAMVDGVSLLLQQILEFRSKGAWNDSRAKNFLDGGAPYYRTYECADGHFVAVGAIERQFYAQLLDGLELDESQLPDRNDRDSWEILSKIFADCFRSRSRHHWVEVFNGTDACVTPVLTFEEVPHHQHIAARESIIKSKDGALIGTRAPRFLSYDGQPLTSDPAEEQTKLASLPEMIRAWDAIPVQP